ncbi:MAG: hypothetical protein A2096_14685 [Spirochaetes bacterium GWF1_41_5]|nr:MAG: hypothetical protein A2096_14685 [Spirochaetes bacterium GWF1_41_5]HBE03879.1 hypothetical protein [Spirochaetia bacterium]
MKYVLPVKITIAMIYLLLPAVIFSQVQDRMRIAIMDLEPKAVSVDVAGVVSDLIRTELFNTGLFRVVERSEMDKIMREQQFQAGGCTDTDCAVQLGQILAVRKMLVGTVSRLGAKFIINARIIDVEKAEMEFAESAQAESEGELDTAVRKFAEKIGNRIRGKNSEPQTTAKPEKVKAEKKTETAGLDKYKKAVKRDILLTGLSGIGAAGGTIIGFAFKKSANIVYNEYINTFNSDDATLLGDKLDSRYANTKAMLRVGEGFTILTGCLAIWTVVDIMRLSKAKKSQVSVIPSFYFDKKNLKAQVAYSF